MSLIDTASLYDEIFSKETLDYSTKKRTMVEIENESSKALDASVPSYAVNCDMKNKIYYPSEAFIQIQMGSVTSNVLAELQLLGFSMAPWFATAKLFCNGSLIEEIQSAQIVMTIRQLTEYSRRYRDSVLSLAGEPVDVFPADSVILSSVGQNFYIPLHYVFKSLVNCPMLYGSVLRVEFTRSLFNDSITTKRAFGSLADSLVTDVYIKDIRIHMPVYTPSATQATEIESKLISNNFEREINVRHMFCHRSQVITGSDGSTSFSVAQGLPSKIFVACVPTGSENSPTEDRTIFSLPAPITSANVLLNSERLLERDLSNTNGDYTSFYKQYLDVFRSQNQVDGSTISGREFLQRCPDFICIDNEHVDQALFASGRSHDVSVELRTAAVNYRMYVVCELRSTMKLKGSLGQVYLVR